MRIEKDARWLAAEVEGVSVETIESKVERLVEYQFSRPEALGVVWRKYSSTADVTTIVRKAFLPDAVLREVVSDIVFEEFVPDTVFEDSIPESALEEFVTESVLRSLTVKEDIDRIPDSIFRELLPEIVHGGLFSKPPEATLRELEPEQHTAPAPKEMAPPQPDDSSEPTQKESQPSEQGKSNAHKQKSGPDTYLGEIHRETMWARAEPSFTTPSQIDLSEKEPTRPSETELRELDAQRPDRKDSTPSEEPSAEDISSKLVDQTVARDGYRCRNCGITGGDDSEVDLIAHYIVPPARGGNALLSNLATLCRSCHDCAQGEFGSNLSKRDYPPNWDGLRKQVYEKNNYRCQNCGLGGGTHGDVELHAHHIVPRSKRGNDTLSNLVTLCSDCHGSIHDHLRS